MNNHTAELLEEHFDTAFDAPNGINKLRELILTLAMQGKLISQSPNDQPVNELLKEIETEKQRLVQEGKIKKPKPLLPVTEEEKPYALPQGWAWVRIGTISSYIQRGKGPTYSDFSSHRVISQKCVRWRGLDLDRARYIDSESLKNYESVRFLRSGDLLWNSTGTGTIGRACLVPDNLNSAELVVDSHITIVRVLNIDSQFLWRWIQNPWVQAGVETSASGTTNQIELNTSTVINHLIPLPPLAEQKRVVAKIDELMVRCDELEKLRTAQQKTCLTVHTATIKQLLNTANPDQHQRAHAFLAEHFSDLYTVKENVAELRKAILQLAMTGKLVSQDPNEQPASELLKEIETERQRLVQSGKIKKPKLLAPVTEKEKSHALPEGWEWVRLGNIGLINPRNIADNDILTGFVPMPLIKEGYADLHSFEERPWSEIKKGYTHFADGDVGMAKITPCFENAKSCVFSNLPNGIGAGTTELHIFRNAFHAVDPRYFLFFLKNPKFISETVTRMTGSAGQKRVPTPLFTELVLALPPKLEQHRIVAKIDELMALCDSLEQQISAASRKQTELLSALIHEQSKSSIKEGLRQASLSKAPVIDLASYRAAIGCYAINKLANAQYFGRTAAAKVMYLAQAHIGLELNLKPEREAAGPLDTWIYDFERQGQDKGWFEVNEKALASGKKKTEYRCMSALSVPATTAEALMSSDQKTKFDRLIYALADKKTEEIEIIATLFAVWNDFLIDGIHPTDKQIVCEVRENWHERKARFSPVELSHWLAWLRSENIIPHGMPPRTIHQPKLRFH